MLETFCIGFLVLCTKPPRVLGKNGIEKQFLGKFAVFPRGVWNHCKGGSLSSRVSRQEVQSICLNYIQGERLHPKDGNIQTKIETEQ